MRAAVFSTLDPDLARIPIPLRKGPSALHYGSVPVDMNAVEQSEPLVYLTDYGVAADGYYARHDLHNPPYRRMFCEAHERPMCRRGVAGRLAAVNESLRTLGIELFVLDGHRTIQCQRELWDYFLGEAAKAVPDPTPMACREFAGQYCSDPSKFDPADSRTWPTHSTGGAVDLTLRRLYDGELLYMGGIFDDPSEVSHTAFYEAPPSPIFHFASSIEAQRNRRILYNALSREGFVNYSYEWWHFDFGTQMWIANSDGRDPLTRKAAFYATIPSIPS